MEKLYTYEELEYLPIEFALEILSTSEIAKAIGVGKSTAHERKTGEYPLSEEEISLLRRYIAAKSDNSVVGTARSMV